MSKALTKDQVSELMKGYAAKSVEARKKKLGKKGFQESMRLLSLKAKEKKLEAKTL